MSDGVVSFVFAIGVAGWVYSQMERRAGVSNTQTNAVAAGIGGLLAFLLLFTFTKFVLHI